MKRLYSVKTKDNACGNDRNLVNAIVTVLRGEELVDCNCFVLVLFRFEFLYKIIKRISGVLSLSLTYKCELNNNIKTQRETIRIQNPLYDHCKR